MRSKNAYAILGLRKGASDQEIKKAWAELLKKVDQSRHTDRFMAIQSAYERLVKPSERAREDILTFNYIRGKFRFGRGEQSDEPQALLDQLLRRQEEEYAKNSENGEVKAAYIKTLMMRSFKKVSRRLWAEAIEDWQRILQLDSTHQRAKNNLLYAYITLGYSYAEHELYDEAIELWERALKMDPEDDRMLHNLALAYEMAGQPEQASPYWDETLRRWGERLAQSPTDAYLRNTIIEARRHHGSTIGGPGKNTPASMDEYKKILEINPEDFEAQYQIASAHYEEQRWTEAQKALMAMMRQFPKNVEVLNMLGWALLNSGQMDQAFQIWNRSLSIEPKNNATRDAIVKARMAVGKAFRDKGMYTQALVHFKALLKLSPDSAEVYMEVGQTYKFKGDKRSAAIAFERVLRLDPKNRSARQFLSDMKMR